jgi:hypothetical protein
LTRSRAPAAFSAADALAWTLGAAAALLAAVIALRALAPEGAKSLAVGGALEVPIYAGASFLLVARVADRGHALGLARAPMTLLLACLALGVVSHGPADFLAWLGQRVLPESEAMLRERAARLAPSSPAERSAIALFVVVLGPFVEELFFRGALYARLCAAGSVARAVGVTAACFAVGHLEARLFPALATLGVVLGVVRAQNYGILPGFLLHAAFNATTLAVAFAEPRRLEVAEAPNPLIALAGALLSGFLLALVVRAARASSGERA